MQLFHFHSVQWQFFSLSVIAHQRKVRRCDRTPRRVPDKGLPVIRCLGRIACWLLRCHPARLLNRFDRRSVVLRNHRVNRWLYAGGD